MENQIVLLKDPNTKPLDWPMGRILEVFPGSDGLVRVVNVKTSTDESDVGYILEVDLEYPSDLHDKHSDFPLAPENKPPTNCKEPRLLTTLEPKTKYVCSSLF
ncbi:uncharacterized protein TNCV_4257901 [Trichonephila clavipes]|nr:uncharacterized protein TNCV_4257901 [Trichonephila clavipes]